MSFLSSLGNIGNALGTGLGAVIGGLPGMLVGGLGSVLGNIFGSKSQEKITKQNYEYAIKLADYQAQLQKDAFDYTNVYNLPMFQVSRLKAANLNPNLAYNGGSAVTSASMPSVSAPHMNQPDPMALAQYQLQMQQMINQSQLTAAQTKKVLAETEGVHTENSIKELKFDEEFQNRPYYEQNAANKAALLDAQANIARWNENIRHNEAQLSNLTYDIKLYLSGHTPNVDDPDEWMQAMEQTCDTIFGQSVTASLMRDVYGNLKINKETELIGKKFEILVEELKLYPEKLKLLSAQAAYEELKLDLARQGINITDPMWSRVLARLLQGFFGEDVNSVVGSAGGKLRGAWNRFVTPVIDQIH